MLKALPLAGAQTGWSDASAVVTLRSRYAATTDCTLSAPAPGVVSAAPSRPALLFSSLVK